MSLQYTIRHCVPGRLRFYLPSVAKLPDIADPLRQRLASIPGVKAARVSTASGSAVIEYDPARRDVPRDLERMLGQTELEPLRQEAASKPRNSGSADKPAISRTRKVFGVSMLVIGVLGVLLPVVPGIPFLIAGALLLGKDGPGVHYVRDKIAQWRSSRSLVRR